MLLSFGKFDVVEIFASLLDLGVGLLFVSVSGEADGTVVMDRDISFVFV